MNVRVRVTQQNIDNGIRQDGDRCPIHHALESVLVQGLPFTVEGTSVEFPQLDYCCIPLPERAQEFIDAFDTNFRVHPFEFNLDIPDSLLRAQEQPNDQDAVLCST